VNDQDRRDLVAALLARPPSEDAWQQLWDVFVGWPDGPARDAALQDAVTGLATWDDDLRRMTSQATPLYRDNRVAPMGRLVRSIEFYRRESGTGDLVRIADSPHAEGLRRLTLIRCDIGAQGIIALARSRYLNELTHLRLAGTYLTRATAPELLCPVGLPSLRSLDLIDCGITDVDLAVLSRSPLAARLTHLSLADNLLGDEAARILAQLASLAHLDTLDLSKNGLGDASRQALQHAPHLARTRLVW